MTDDDIDRKLVAPRRSFDALILTAYVLADLPAALADVRTTGKVPRRVIADETGISASRLARFELHHGTLDQHDLQALVLWLAKRWLG